MLYRGRRDVETYRSGRNEPHSKCGYAFTGVREFESLRFRQSKPKSNTRVFGLGFSFAKIQVLLLFFGCPSAVVSVFSVFVGKVRIALSVAVTDGFCPERFVCDR